MSDGAGNMDADARVALTEIKGDVRLILAGQTRTNDDVKDLRERVHGHSNRIQVIEAREHQRQGAVVTAKVLWLAVGGTAGVMGVLGILLRSQGV